LGEKKRSLKRGENLEDKCPEIGGKLYKRKKGGGRSTQSTEDFKKNKKKTIQKNGRQSIN